MYYIQSTRDPVWGEGKKNPEILSYSRSGLCIRTPGDLLARKISRGSDVGFRYQIYRHRRHQVKVETEEYNQL